MLLVVIILLIIIIILGICLYISNKNKSISSDKCKIDLQKKDKIIEFNNKKYNPNNYKQLLDDSANIDTSVITTGNMMLKMSSELLKKTFTSEAELKLWIKRVIDDNLKSMKKSEYVDDDDKIDKFDIYVKDEKFFYKDSSNKEQRIYTLSSKKVDSMNDEREAPDNDEWNTAHTAITEAYEKYNQGTLNHSDATTKIVENIPMIEKYNGSVDYNLEINNDTDDSSAQDATSSDMPGHLTINYPYKQVPEYINLIEQDGTILLLEGTIYVKVDDDNSPSQIAPGYNKNINNSPSQMGVNYIFICALQTLYKNGFANKPIITNFITNFVTKLYSDDKFRFVDADKPHIIDLFNTLQLLPISFPTILAKHATGGINMMGQNLSGMYCQFHYKHLQTIIEGLHKFKLIKSIDKHEDFLHELNKYSQDICTCITKKLNTT